MHVFMLKQGDYTAIVRAPDWKAALEMVGMEFCDGNIMDNSGEAEVLFCDKPMIPVFVFEDKSRVARVAAKTASDAARLLGGWKNWYWRRDGYSYGEPRILSNTDVPVFVLKSKGRVARVAAAMLTEAYALLGEDWLGARWSQDGITTGESRVLEITRPPKKYLFQAGGKFVVATCCWEALEAVGLCNGSVQKICPWEEVIHGDI